MAAQKKKRLWPNTALYPCLFLFALSLPYIVIASCSCLLPPSVDWLLPWLFPLALLVHFVCFYNLCVCVRLQKSCLFVCLTKLCFFKSRLGSRFIIYTSALHTDDNYGNTALINMLRVWTCVMHLANWLRHKPLETIYVHSTECHKVNWLKEIKNSRYLE